MRSEIRHIFFQLKSCIRAEDVEGALTLLQELYGEVESVFEILPAGFLLVDRDGAILQANLLAAEMLHADPASPLTMVGQSLYRYIRRDDRDRLYLHLRAVFRRKRYQSCEVQLLEGGGVRLDSVYERDYGKAVAKSVVSQPGGDKFMVDILRQANEELEQRVEERTAALRGTLAEKDRIEALLIEHAARLERANRELYDFAYIASHDLQEPLRKVRTFGDLLMDRVGPLLGEEGRDYISRMQNASARMQELLVSLLAYSRVETKGRPFERTDLKDSVEKALSNLEIPIKETRARVAVADLPAIDADGVQMVQLFQNLIGNALKYGANGKPPKVKISSRCGRDGKSGRREFCNISVRDNGIGFEEKYLDKIFQPFQRLHGRDAYTGVGMGLAICKKIVDRHGGTITAKSAPGNGSTFIVSLPVDAARD